MNKHIILEKQSDRIYGRISYTAETKGGIVVFPHYKIKEQVEEGFFKIDSITIKESGDKKVGFISGDNIIPDETIDIDNLSIKNLHDLLSYGVIKNLSSYKGYECIVIKEPTIIDSTVYLAFLVDGEFIFIKNLKYIDNNVKFIRDLSTLQKTLHRRGLSNIYLASSITPIYFSMDTEEEEFIKSNLERIIWRRISHSRNHEGYCILLYNCIKDSPFDNELYMKIINYNNSINKLIRESDIIDEYSEEDKTMIYKALSKYGYEKL